MIWKLLYCLVNTSALFSQESDTLLIKQKIQDLQTKSRQIQETILKEEKRTQEFKIKHQQQTEKRRQELTLLLNSTDSLKKTADRLNQKQTKIRQGEKELELRQQYLKQVLIDLVKSLKFQIQEGFPFETESRSGTLNLLLKDLEETEMSAGEGIQRLMAICDYEEQLNTSADLISTEVTLTNQNRLPVKMLRIGKQVLAYASLEGERYGLMVKERTDNKTMYQWQTDNFSYEERKGIRTAIAVKEGKKPPQLVSFPVNLMLEGGNR